MSLSVGGDWMEGDNGMFWKNPEYPDPDNWVWSTQGVIDMHRPERWF
jgi:hypothetical protein